MKAVVIDDEKMARDAIELLIEKNANDIELVGKASSVDEGIKLIAEKNPDIVFLDIHMPEKNGFALFDEIDSSKFKVIFTTAHSEYAIKAINLSASYYLLKPISPTDFQNAIAKIKSEVMSQIPDHVNLEFLRELLSGKSKYSSTILVNTKAGYERVEVSNIRYFEGDKNYTRIFTANDKFIVPRTLKEFEEILQPDLFFRSHQSHLVNKLFVKRVLNTKPDQIELYDGTIINLSRDKKKYFLDWLAK